MRSLLGPSNPPTSWSSAELPLLGGAGERPCSPCWLPYRGPKLDPPSVSVVLVELTLLGWSSSSNPPTSKNDTFLGVLIDDTSPGLCVSIFITSRSSLVSLLSPGNCQSLPIPIPVTLCALTGTFPAVAIGAGLGVGSDSLSSGSTPSPRPLTRSSSLPQCRVAVPRREVVRSMLSLIDPNFHLCFFTPRSRTKEPRTRALATAVAKRISIEARRERYC